MAIYDKPVRFLMKEMVDDFSLQEGQEFQKQQVIGWFNEHYPKIKTGTLAAHLIRFSTNAKSRIHHNTKYSDDDRFFQIDGSHFRLYDSNQDPPPIYEASGIQPEKDDDELQGPTEFAYEADLKNYLAKNLSVIEAGLKLYEDEEIKGIEFPVGGRFIDILAVDSNGKLVVIELKVSKGYDRVVGQLMRYMAWIQKNQAESGQQVRGIIVAREISEDLKLACSLLPDVHQFEYELSLTLKRVDTKSVS